MSIPRNVLPSAPPTVFWVSSATVPRYTTVGGTYPDSTPSSLSGDFVASFVTLSPQCQGPEPPERTRRPVGVRRIGGRALRSATRDEVLQRPRATGRDPTRPNRRRTRDCRWRT